MDFVASQLLPGEAVTYRGRLHWLIFGNWGGIAIILALVALAEHSGLLWLIAAACLLPPAIRMQSSVLVITDRRVLVKVGWLSHRVLETLLTKVEGISVEQGMFGRMFGYGTLVVRGTGGTHERFPFLARPMEFRKHVLLGTSSAQSPQAVTAPSPDRQERDCPSCGERILAKARVCKHCGRDITPIETATA